jgi:hypothetical protein
MQSIHHSTFGYQGLIFVTIFGLHRNISVNNGCHCCCNQWLSKMESMGANSFAIMAPRITLEQQLYTCTVGRQRIATTVCHIGESLA